MQRDGDDVHDDGNWWSYGWCNDVGSARNNSCCSGERDVRRSTRLITDNFNNVRRCELQLLGLAIDLHSLVPVSSGFNPVLGDLLLKGRKKLHPPCGPQHQSLLAETAAHHFILSSFACDKDVAALVRVQAAAQKASLAEPMGLTTYCQSDYCLSNARMLPFLATPMGLCDFHGQRAQAVS